MAINLQFFLRIQINYIKLIRGFVIVVEIDHDQVDPSLTSYHKALQASGFNEWKWWDKKHTIAWYFKENNPLFYACPSTDGPRFAFLNDSDGNAHSGLKYVSHLFLLWSFLGNIETDTWF